MTTHRAALAVGGVCVIVLAAGFALKAQCIVDWPWTGQQWERLCYNDIQPLFEARDIDVHTFPYISSYMAPDGLKYGGIEYPVLTGLFMWAVGYLAQDPNGYLVATALLLAPFAALATWLLYRMSGVRALYWAAAPTLGLYAFHNWDLLVVCSAVAAIYAWRGGRYTAAAILIGIGGALKLYPLLFLAPLFLERWTAGDRSGARRCLAWGLGSWFAINLPIIYLNPPSWWLTYEFHRLRSPNFDSFWSQVLPEASPSLINNISGGLILITLVGVLWWVVRRARIEGAFPFVQACAAVTTTFILWSKVQSPQYMLWLLPFFALLQIRARWWIAFSLVDIAAYVAVFRYFHEISAGSAADAALYAVVITVFARVSLWAVLVLVFVRSDMAVRVLPRRRESEVRTAVAKPVTPSF